MFGPLYRFDHHRPDDKGAARTDPGGRNVLYVGADLATSACEVFGEVGHAAVCPAYRVAILAPTSPLRLFDLAYPGAAMSIGALPALADAALPRMLTQEWARAIYEDQPTSQVVTGVRYRSAYNGNIALALWDSDTTVTTVQDNVGALADVALDDPRMLSRFRAAMTRRRITVQVVDARVCPRCA